MRYNILNVWQKTEKEETKFLIISKKTGNFILI